jgi:hypothetical protein
MTSGARAAAEREVLVRGEGMSPAWRPAQGHEAIQEKCQMTRFLLMTASAMALGMVAPLMAQAFGPSDALIEQIADSNSATLSQTGISRSGNASDIEQIGDNAAEVTQRGRGSLHKSTIPQAVEKATYAPQGSDNTSETFIDRHGAAGIAQP